MTHQKEWMPLFLLVATKLCHHESDISESKVCEDKFCQLLQVYRFFKMVAMGNIVVLPL